MCYCYCHTMLHSNNCPEVRWYSFGVKPFLGDKGRRLEGGVCNKWFMYVHYLGTVILIIKANEMHYFSNTFWSRTLYVSDRSTITS